MRDELPMPSLRYLELGDEILVETRVASYVTVRNGRAVRVLVPTEPSIGRFVEPDECCQSDPDNLVDGQLVICPMCLDDWLSEHLISHIEDISTLVLELP